MHYFLALSILIYLLCFMKVIPLSSYHATLCEALSALAIHIASREIVLVETNELETPFQYGGISYGTHKEANAEIATVKGKRTKKWAHVCIWRRESGTYEINFYIL